VKLSFWALVGIAVGGLSTLFACTTPQQRGSYHLVVNDDTISVSDKVPRDVATDVILFLAGSPEVAALRKQLGPTCPWGFSALWDAPAGTDYDFEVHILCDRGGRCGRSAE